MNNIGKTEEQLNLAELSKKIPLVEERLNVGVRQVETGTVRINKKIISQEVSQEIPVTQEEVHVERIAINEYVETAPATRYEGDTTIIPVVKEVLVVEKRLMLVEELRITKKHVTTTTTINELLRKEEIEISRIDTTQ
ncbi:YsnF/AvaK domain-containing protein [Mucilaginibacter arboris]|uniref:DUF2382 domain-containing protein n=1 Tax=Mucilaginibacter arboris TaxID=2682090 RepID=A0A7K1T0U1_9SPHI|nr:YsnF/AvaK domain-containing protein [Mucilaginibacter arboris]MVN23169.1 DUF2382 domain-containing protein [Mucilaginibacter arboris]